MQNKNNNFIKYSWFILAMVFLVILAGGIVRMTQSGMGCPDWPRCFGMWIPPTDASQLPADFVKYLDKQDIDHSFNVYHTWIEYINRLLGALLGVFIFIYFIYSLIKFRKTDKIIVFSTFALVLVTGFQGFLGKLVVDGNLSVVKITIHMLVALIIAAIPLYVISRTKGNRIMIPQSLKTISIVSFIAVIIQIIFGTQVRELIDEISKGLAYQQRELWISGAMGTVYYIHRSFSWIILGLTSYLWWKSQDFPELKRNVNLISGSVIIAIAAGLTMNFFDIPALAQPIHLFIACALSMSLFYYIIRTK
ncbi:COX15/CtaA family protein [Saprospiraceae bacterium]|nr:COX15/CtaA family protein [Saprospiraceae bacterium]